MGRQKDHNQILREFSDNWTLLIDEADANTTYIGKAEVGTAPSDPHWQIRRYLKNGTVTTGSFAASDDEFNQIWDNRASLSYS